ncbi:MAG: hypothetical protein MI724_09340, partial [Spirochaetales bacterium]|nr:hypothetical protein [Spirochaetales bacterium]
MRHNFSIRLKMLLVVGSVVLIGMAAITVGSARVATQRIRADFITAVETELAHVAWGFDGLMEQIRHTVRLIAIGPAVRGADETISSYMETLAYMEATGEEGLAIQADVAGGIEQQAFESFERVGSVYPSARFVYFGTRYGGYVQWPLGTFMDDYDPRERPWYTTARSAPGEVIHTDPYYWAPEDVTIISTVSTVRDLDDEVVGVVGSETAHRSAVE